MVKTKQQHYWNISIPWEVFMELSEYMGDSRTRETMGDLAGQAIHHWIEDQRHLSEGASRSVASMLKGYQWKRLFLPDGTMIRTVYKGIPRIAEVMNSQLVFEGATITPHEFANVSGAPTRNAWKVVWLLFVGEREWKLADDCRPARTSRSSLT